MWKSFITQRAKLISEIYRFGPKSSEGLWDDIKEVIHLSLACYLRDFNTWEPLLTFEMGCLDASDATVVVNVKDAQRFRISFIRRGIETPGLPMIIVNWKVSPVFLQSMLHSLSSKKTVIAFVERLKSLYGAAGSVVRYSFFLFFFYG